MPTPETTAASLWTLINDYQNAGRQWINGPNPYYDEAKAKLDAALQRVTTQSVPVVPVDMVLFCPCCGVQHIDEPEYDEEGPGGCGRVTWGNPPHRSHLCAACGFQWRPADVPTNGVKAIKTKGKNDSPLAEAAKLDPNKVQICRVDPVAYENGQPCACPEGTCNLYKAGLRPVGVPSGDSPVKKLDPIGNPKLSLTVLESLAIDACNLVKAWAESDRLTPFPEEAHMKADAVLMFAAQRREGVQ